MVATGAVPSRGTGNRLIVGIVLAVVTFWLFAQTTLNVAPAIRSDLEISESLSTSRSASARCSRGSSSWWRAGWPTASAA